MDIQKLKISVAGIRGIVGENFTIPVVSQLVAAFGQKVGGRIVIGRDTRPSGAAFQKIAVGTLLGLGIDVVDVGVLPIPTIELIVQETKSQGGIVITASHNPPQWNALKLLDSEGTFVDEKVIEEITTSPKEISWATFQKIGNLFDFPSPAEFHIERILELPYFSVSKIRQAKFKIVYDGNNGTGCLVIPTLLETLGCEVISINDEPDGIFAHPPEPIPENIRETAKLVKETGAHLGMVTDPDADRLALIDEWGEPVGEEYTLTIAADYILSKQSGAVVTNLSTSGLIDFIAQKHRVPIYREKIGEYNVVKGLKVYKGVIGGEGNGGVILPDFHYGRDAVLAAVLVLAFLAEKKSPLSKVVKNYPEYYMLKEKLPNFRIKKIEKELIEKLKPQEVNRADGLRLQLTDGWVHIRHSGTEPIVRLIIESSSKERTLALSYLIKDLLE